MCLDLGTGFAIHREMHNVTAVITDYHLFSCVQHDKRHSGRKREQTPQKRFAQTADDFHVQHFFGVREKPNPFLLVVAHHFNHRLAIVHYVFGDESPRPLPPFVSSRPRA